MDEDADRTEKLVSMLSAFYRTGLNDGEETIRFEDELKNASSYTEMERIIENGRFDVEYNIDEEVYNYNCITFILQPIRERNFSWYKAETQRHGQNCCHGKGRNGHRTFCIGQRCRNEQGNTKRNC